MNDIQVVDDASAAYASTAARLGSGARDVEASRLFLYGTLQQISDRMVDQRHKYGADCVKVSHEHIEQLAPLVRSLGEQ